MPQQQLRRVPEHFALCLHVADACRAPTLFSQLPLALSAAGTALHSCLPQSHKRMLCVVWDRPQKRVMIKRHAGPRQNYGVVGTIRRCQ